LDLWPGNMGLKAFSARLRSGAPPVIGYISQDRFKLDLRTIFPRQEEPLIRRIREVVTR
jgi:hypothetical protein